MRQVNPFDRSPSGDAGIRAELRATLALAIPLSAANIAMIAMAVTNTVMVARLGTMPLAAAGLGGMFYFTIGIVLQGILFAVAPIVAHALGAGDRRAAGRTAGAGFILALLLSLPFVIALASLQRLLQRLGYDATLVAEIGRYLRALAWSGPAFMISAVLRSLLAALSQARAILVVLLVGVITNVVLNWSMIFGHLGAPAMGLAGSGYASAINQWLMLVGLMLCTRTSPEYTGLHLLRGAFAARWTQMAEILRLGWPMGAIRGIESGVFLATGVLMGLFGAAALGAHQLILNCAGVSFMVPLGLSQAATVRVAYEIGAGRPREANRAGFVALALGVLFMSAAALVFSTMPRTIIGLYIDLSNPANRDLVQIARRLMAIAAIFQVFDGMQTIAAGALRGYKDTLIPLLLATFGYWGVGFVGGWILAFPLGYGAVGLWWGLALGLATVALLLTLRLHQLAAPIARTAGIAAAR
ncbi:MAG: MATE family efflux transporter [Alphaproteobacteria bacterium]|nr:MATE family efflux transporter [Alphaproteobacteria bacterium]